jgi:hypothetical protein
LRPKDARKHGEVEREKTRLGQKTEELQKETKETEKSRDKDPDGAAEKPESL